MNVLNSDETLSWKKLCVWIVLWLLQGTHLTLILTFLFNILSDKTQFKIFSNTKPRKGLYLTLLKVMLELKKKTKKSDTQAAELFWIQYLPETPLKYFFFL